MCDLQYLVNKKNLKPTGEWLLNENKLHFSGFQECHQGLPCKALGQVFLLGGRRYYACIIN